MNEYKPCKFCGGKANDGLHRIECSNCGASTRSYVATLGDYQSECEAAQMDWYGGRYKQKNPANEVDVKQ